MSADTVGCFLTPAVDDVTRGPAILWCLVARGGWLLGGAWEPTAYVGRFTAAALVVAAVEEDAQAREGRIA